MTRVLSALRSALMELPHYVDGLACLPVEVPSIVWMDDLALSLSVSVAAQLPELLQQVIGRVHSTFGKFGLLLNCGPGKTEAAMTFRGKGPEALQRTPPRLTMSFRSRLCVLTNASACALPCRVIWVLRSERVLA